MRGRYVTPTTDRLEAAVRELVEALREEVQAEVRVRTASTPRLLSIAEAAEACGLSRSTFYGLMGRGENPLDQHRPSTTHPGERPARVHGRRWGALMPGTLASLLIKLGLDATGVEQGIARTQQSLLGFSSGAGMAMRSANRAANGGSHWPPPQRHAGDDVLDAHLRRGAALQDFLDLQVNGWLVA